MLRQYFSQQGPSRWAPAAPSDLKLQASGQEKPAKIAPAARGCGKATRNLPIL
jgi:hypothetical protein